MLPFNISQLILAFLEGVGLILSPCILPILPIVLAASLDGGRRRPLGIITGFIGAFTIFALISKQILTWLHADPQIIRNAALGLLVVFGITMFSRKLSDKLLNMTQGLANFGQSLASHWNQSKGYFSGLIIGTLIGLIWTPCAGPVMAAAIVQIIQAKNGIETSLTIVMFALGAGIPMLAIAVLERKIVSQIGFLKTHSYSVRRALGVVIILAAILIYEDADIAFLGATDTSSEHLNDISDSKLLKALDVPYPAPPITGIQSWLNSAPLNISELRNKVVLIDFWTYSCINCIRTLPYITQWDAKYRDKGLIIIGIHSPEFEFEKKEDNVKNAISRYGILYPVALDNNLSTWASYSNKYWPAHYLINKDGQVVYIHYGEGDYEITEHNIQVLLGIAKDKGPQTLKAEQPFLPSQTPETYLGYARAVNFANTELVHDQEFAYQSPENLALNKWSLEGTWKIGPHSITATKAHSAIRLHFKARKIFLVLGSSKDQPITAHIVLNGKPVGALGGEDVKENVITVDQHRLYELIDQKIFKEGEIQIQSDAPGLQAYAFTFGS